MTPTPETDHLERNLGNAAQIEIKRLRRVLHDIAASRPDQHMDIERNPELVNWICDTCHKASVGAYPYSPNNLQG